MIMLENLTFKSRITIKKIVKKNNFILVGSSMGSWLALKQFKYFEKQIKGFLGIGSAPEFLERLMWNKFSKKIKKEIISKGIYNLKHGNYDTMVNVTSDSIGAAVIGKSEGEQLYTNL